MWKVPETRGSEGIWGSGLIFVFDWSMGYKAQAARNETREESRSLVGHLLSTRGTPSEDSKVNGT